MGEIESRVIKRGRNIKIRNAIILSLYGVAALTFIAMAPNAARLLKHVDPPGTKKRPLTSRLRTALHTLEQRGYVTRNGQKYELTDKGRQSAEVLNLSAQKMRRQKWDRKWRIVMFDVWEKRSGIRQRLRNMLKNAGFMKLQNSVWIYPYPCEELFMLMRADLKVGRGMLYLIAEEIENDKHLRAHFGLR